MLPLPIRASVHTSTHPMFALSHIQYGLYSRLAPKDDCTYPSSSLLAYMICCIYLYAGLTFRFSYYRLQKCTRKCCYIFYITHQLYHTLLQCSDADGSGTTRQQLSCTRRPISVRKSRRRTVSVLYGYSAVSFLPHIVLLYTNYGLIYIPRTLGSCTNTEQTARMMYCMI